MPLSWSLFYIDRAACSYVFGLGFRGCSCVYFSILHKRIHAAVYVWDDTILVALVVCLPIDVTADARLLLCLRIQ